MFFAWICEENFVYCKGGEGGRTTLQIKKEKKKSKNAWIFAELFVY